MEKDVTVRCRRDDLDLVHKLLCDVLKRFQQESKQNSIQVNIDEESFLSNDSCLSDFLTSAEKYFSMILFRIGGVELYAMNGKI